ncbi:unnamed protein product [Medioppia subpectinata]|uniref:Uncharacterized protein n=1 Tax=Medioppia subpectinata TaxID=1979941 RepID=A0A7R9KP45_9ACAR|nr:unnamed protein product [Medioppia subpectinata]CAG2106833.1 unnamed protein product [Medioppia subpectinata]
MAKMNSCFQCCCTIICRMLNMRFLKWFMIILCSLATVMFLTLLILEVKFDLGEKSEHWHVFYVVLFAFGIGVCGTTAYGACRERGRLMRFFTLFLLVNILSGIASTVRNNDLWFYPIVSFVLFVICGSYVEEVCRKNKQNVESLRDVSITVQSAPQTSGVPTVCPTRPDLETRVKALLDYTADNIKRFESNNLAKVNISYDLATLANALDSIDDLSCKIYDAPTDDQSNLVDLCGKLMHWEQWTQGWIKMMDDYIRIG